MKILCVAEKPSIARSISEILSSGNGLRNRPGKDQYCRNYEFDYRMPPGSVVGRDGDMVKMVITSVKGHLMGSDFPEQYRKWTSCSPDELFTAPIETFVSKDCKEVAQNLAIEVRSADLLMIWTDCDREGEHIGAEVVKVCQKAKPRIQVKRAKFSAIIANQIHRAAQNPVELDWRAAEAVESRIELDLRLGAAFTRMQCLSLQARNVQLQKRVISYGPCQFPTLGFVVDRYILARDFIPRPFWYIAVMDKRNNMEVDFKWSRNHLFERQAVQIIYQRCRANPEATVTKVASKVTRKFKPSPLTTVELQKSASRLLKMTPKRVLDVAEKLYQQGILSYPRTETDQYDKEFDFHSLINKQTCDANWGSFASRLADAQADAFDRPVNGKKNDKAHPPIHPTKYAGNLVGEEKKVYEYVTRRFLASCSKHAVGKQTTVELNIAQEIFNASGIIVVERNYLEVYTYDKWGGPALPEYVQGECFLPTKMEMKEGETTRPKLLTEADLVSLMDRNGIGTDATIAEHISKIIEREYVKVLKEGQMNYLIPSELGMGLVEGYNAIEFDGNKSLCKPLLRRETEERMNLICEGTRTREETVEQSLQEYKAVFDKAKQEIHKLIDRVDANLRGEYAQGDGQPGNQDDAMVQSDAGDDEDDAGRGFPPPARREIIDIDESSEEEEQDMILGQIPTPSPPLPIRSRPIERPIVVRSTMASSNSRSKTTNSSTCATRQGNNNNSSFGGRTTQSTSIRPNPSGTVCFTCGEPGHWSNDCPSKADDRGIDSNDQGCFTCGERGHWASECTQASSDSSRRVKRSRGASSSRSTSTRGTSSRGRGRGRR